MNFFREDWLMRNIKVRDNREGLVNANKYSNKILLRPETLEGKRKNEILVREGTAKRLARAALFLPQKHQLIIFDGYRDAKKQEIYFKNRMRRLKQLNPDWNIKKIKREAMKLVADPESFASHLTGGAVDVSIAENNRQILMGGFIESIDKEKKISENMKKNRKLLEKIMIKAGFIKDYYEWWHWYYGDRYWAAAKKKKFAIYDSFI